MERNTKKEWEKAEVESVKLNSCDIIFTSESDNISTSESDNIDLPKVPTD